MPGLCWAPDIVAGINAELAKHRALAVAVPSPAVVKIFSPPVNKLCSGISICSITPKVTEISLSHRCRLCWNASENKT